MAKGPGRPALPKHKRVVVPMDVETLGVFEQMAKASGLSLGRTVAEWCRDTAEGAQFVAAKMMQARKAPGVVMREMHAMSKGMLDEIEALQRDAAAHRRGGTRQRDAGAGG